MRKIGLRRKRQALYGWLKWIPVIALPFGILLTDTYLNVKTWHSDYVYGQLYRQFRSLQAQLAAVKADEARFEAVDRLSEKAVELAMVPPQPAQLQSVQGPMPALISPTEAAEAVPLTFAALAQDAERVGGKVQQILTEKAPEFLGREVAPRVDALIGAARPFPEWLHAEVVPKVEAVVAMTGPLAGALAGAVVELRDSALQFARPAAGEPVGGEATMANAAPVDASLEELEDIEPQAALPPAVVEVDSSPEQLLESL
ncbi:MAG: hypothetical protein HYV26_04545 [Candidatus Hydrogenedentes bacterium]|nr:hypothetical protein [Candidatus Hydrogenedentota bacterium]